MAPSKSRQIGLARTLSKLGYCSRSRASELIRAGQVRLNGQIRLDPETPVRDFGSTIHVDGIELKPKTKIYLMLNKPRGVVTTAADEKGRKTVYDLLEPTAWAAPIGRLDKASEGLLLLTNDSEWSARIQAPETHLDKTYHVQINKVIDNDFVGRLLKGVHSDGECLRAKAARVLRSGHRNTWLEIVLDEGKNRQIRRMVEAMHLEVLRLLRVSIGPVKLGQLAKGACRELTRQEKLSLDTAMKTAARGRSLH